MNSYIDVTEKWIKQAKPKKGSIKFLNYSITQDSEKFDSSNSILDINVGDDYHVGTWFRNNVWGNTRIQPAIVFPHKKRSADLRLFGNCSLIDEQTIEIKTITSKRKDGIILRLKEAKGQSSNVLLDLSNNPFTDDEIKDIIEKYYVSHDWLKVVIAKRKDNILFVWQKI